MFSKEFTYEERATNKSNTYSAPFTLLPKCNKQRLVVVDTPTRKLAAKFSRSCVMQFYMFQQSRSTSASECGQNYLCIEGIRNLKRTATLYTKIRFLSESVAGSSCCGEVSSCIFLVDLRWCLYFDIYCVYNIVIKLQLNVQ